MSVTNDELIEEILWKAYAKGLGKEVNERAKTHMDAGMRKSFEIGRAHV